MPDTFSQQTFSIQIEATAPYKIDFIEYFVNDVSVEKSSSQSFSYTASEEQNNSTLTIKVSLKDKNGNIVSEEKAISLSF